MTSTAPEGDAAPSQPDGREAGREPEPAAAMTPRPPPGEIPVRRRVPPAGLETLRRVRAALDRL